MLPFRGLCDATATVDGMRPGTSPAGYGRASGGSGSSTPKTASTSAVKAHHIPLTVTGIFDNSSVVLECHAAGSAKSVSAVTVEMTAIELNRKTAVTLVKARPANRLTPSSTG